MATLKKCGLVSVLGLAITGSAIAATPFSGWYSTVLGGVSYLPNNVSIFGRSNADYDMGYTAGGAVGYKSGPIRYQGEVMYMHAETNAFNLFTVPQSGVGGDSDAISAIASIFYDFDDMSESFSPFLGLGIGYAHVSSELNATGPVAITAFKATDNVFAYQATAGITYNFEENAAFTLAYRYLGTTKADNLGKSFQASLATLGLSYRFNTV